MMEIKLKEIPVRDVAKGYMMKKMVLLVIMVN